MIKAVFFDLDGTLLTSEKTVLPSARAAIRRAKREGVRFFLATGRSFSLERTLGWTKDDIDLFDGFICCNGAHVTVEGETTVFCIHPEAVRRAVEIVNSYPDVHLALHMENEVCAFNYPLDFETSRIWGLSDARVHPLDDEAVESAIKILVFYEHMLDSEEPLPEKMVEELMGNCAGLANVYHTDFGRTVQICPMEAGKRAAVDMVRKQLGLLPEETAVFGDDLNDMDMIAACPNGVAMGNAMEEVKSVAPFVTGTNDENGVADALRRLMGWED